MAKAKTGSVFELSTPRGLAYAQCTHLHARYGHLIRVLPGFFEQRPNGFELLARRPTVFVTFFPLGAAVSRQVVTVVGNEPVPKEAQEFPIFRAGVPDPATGKVGVWWLWDGEKEWRAGTLSDEQRRLPIRGVWNDTLLIERIVAGWTPENDAR
jgi:hypothetical protein